MSLLDKLKLEPKSEPEIEFEFEPELAQDPEPGEKPARRRAVRKAAPVVKKPPASTAKLAREVAEDLASLIEGAAVVWGLQDQCCAPALGEQAKPIADALTGILSRNPRLLAKFAGTDIVSYTLQFAALGKALLPVGKAIYANHVSGAVDDEQENPHDNALHLNAFPPFSGLPRTVPA